MVSLGPLRAGSVTIPWCESLGTVASTQNPGPAPPAHRIPCEDTRGARAQALEPAKEHCRAEPAASWPVARFGGREQASSLGRATGRLLGLERPGVEDKAACWEQGVSPRVGKMPPSQGAEPPLPSVHGTNGAGSRCPWAGSRSEGRQSCDVSILVSCSASGLSCEPRSFLPFPSPAPAQRQFHTCV